MTNSYDNMARVVQIIDEYTVVINRGENHDIEKGDRFLIFALGEPVLDFDTNEDLGRLELVRGRAEAVHVQEGITTLKSAIKVEVGTRRKIYSKPVNSGVGALLAFSYAGGKEEEIIEDPRMEFADLEAVIGDYAKVI